MSNQSGIKASQELRDKFNELVTGGHRALILEIEKESCVPSHLIEGTDDFHNDFALIQQHLSENEARYIVYRDDLNRSGSAEEDSYIFISFVPDKAHVRSKMLYASSANTIQRELGGNERFPNTIFWTEIDEVSSSGWKAYERHVKAPNPFSSEEQALQDVIEKETDQMQGTEAKKSHIHGSTGLAMDCEEAVIEALESLREKSESASVCVKIDVFKEQVVLKCTQDGPRQLTDIEALIDPEEPQYTIFKHIDNPAMTIFIYTCPSKSKIKERMIYASNRLNFANFAGRTLQVHKSIEATDPADVADLLKEELTPVATPDTSRSSTPRFSRPKPPGRRN